MGYTYELIQDTDPINPREDDNLGTMICFHRRYNLGDKHEMEPEAVKLMMDEDEVIWLPLYLYDHSGITMKTTPFSCPWDSGQVGIIYISLDKVRAEYNVKHVSKKLVEQVKALLTSEVEVYDQYLTGDVYGYRILDSNGDEVDSCWGFYGEKYAKSEAISAVRHLESKAA